MANIQRTDYNQLIEERRKEFEKVFQATFGQELKDNIKDKSAKNNVGIAINIYGIKANV
ncbi:hypothetical protein [Bacillus cereus]|uniref:hypothetical protein n=1 Tax=Bacillus cereus TaxID=1396 RepID=UPI0015B7C632|nr:hypothetical protein [Bacillus cereus]